MPMLPLRPFAGLVALAAGAIAQSPAVPPPGPATTNAAADAPRLVADLVLPELPLGPLLHQVLGIDAPRDRKVRLGSAGSELWHAAADPADTFWLLCDRGPNGLVTVDGKPRRTFLVPEFTPLLLQVQQRATVLEPVRIVPVRGRSGAPVTGLPGLPGHDEVPYDATGREPLAYVPSGIDPEGMVRLADGSFWLAEEYGPSLLQVDADGKVRLRLLPQGLELRGADYPVQATLPAILARRRENRGFESLALSPDGKRLFAMLQSALPNPDRATGDRCRWLRLFVFDPAAGRMVAEHVYPCEPVAGFDPRTPLQGDMKVSAMAMTAGGTLLVVERTDLVARLYAVDLTTATDLLGSKWDDPGQAPSLESLPDLATHEVRPLAKRLLADLTALPGVPGKIEGLAVIDARTIAVTNDNDCDLGTLDADGNNQGAGVRTHLFVIRLPTPLR